MKTIYLTEEHLIDILSTMYAYGMIDLQRARVDAQYTIERIKMFLEAKTMADEIIRA